MRIAIIGDMHLCGSKLSPQYAFAARAAERIQRDGVKTVINVGDITAFGEYEALCMCCDLFRDMDHYFVLGNSDIRDEATAAKFVSSVSPRAFLAEGRKVLGIHTPGGVIEIEDRALLDRLEEGSIVFFHHYVRSFKAESRVYLEALLAQKSLTVIHGHAHKVMDERIGQSRVFGIRALDPDKAIGNYPTITYMDVEPHSIRFEEVYLDVAEETLADIRRHIGMSCVDNERDVIYATEHHVPYIELRFNGHQPLPDDSFLPLLETWRQKTGGYLSIHMPYLTWENGELRGEARWHEALSKAILMGADSLTIHPPRVHVGYMERGSEVYEMLLSYYVRAVQAVGDGVRVGIENLHMEKGETTTDRRFGYTPKEIAGWIDDINERLAAPRRVGHVLDVGHARNNGIYASLYPVGRWYEYMGERTVGYHVHQAISKAGGMKNHNPVTDWFGPMISYVSFFWAWERGMIRHAPIFLEVRGCENYELSTHAFDKLFSKS